MMAQGGANIALRGGGGMVQQGDGCDNHAVQTIAALGSILGDKGRLDWMRGCQRSQTLQGHDLFIAHRAEWNRASAGDLIIHQHSARPAFPQPAAVFRAIESKIIAQNIQQRCFRRCLYGKRLAVDGEGQGRRGHLGHNDRCSR